MPSTITKDYRRTSRPSRWRLPPVLCLALLGVLSACCTGVQPPSLDRSVFSGLEHRALGRAAIDLELVVNGIDTSGRDGLATHVAPASEWEADVHLVNLKPGATITYSAVTDRPVSTMAWSEEGGALEVSASFDRSPTYSLEIFNERTTILRRAAHPSAIPALRVIVDDPPSPLPSLADLCRAAPEFCVLTIGFRVLGPSGECQWEINFTQPVVVDVGDDQIVRGDRILLTEEHGSEHAHPAMVFDEMRIQASGVDSIRVLSERVARPH